MDREEGPLPCPALGDARPPSRGLALQRAGPSLPVFPTCSTTF